MRVCVILVLLGFSSSPMSANHVSSAACRLFKGSFVDSPCFEPRLNGTFHGWIGLELVKQLLVVDVIEGAFEIGVQDIFLLLLDRIEDRFDSIVTGASW